MNHVEILKKMVVCEEARIWADTQPDFETAWRNCKRSDWMMWLLQHAKVAITDAEWRLLACDIAESALKYIKDAKVKATCEATIETARRFAFGDATVDELHAASDTAWAACDTAEDAARAASDAAWAACDAAEDAACATCNAAYYAARAACDAARAACDAAYGAAYYAARAASNAAWAASDAAYGAAWAEQADTIRKYIGWSRVEEAIKKI